MKFMGLLIGILLVVPVIVRGESNYWVHIQQLVEKYDAPQGNPQLEAYLKGLTPDQMVQAAREYSQYAEEKFPTENWAEALMDVGLTLAFYETEQGRLSEDRLSILLKCIANADENPFLRESLVRLLRQRYWAQMTAGQRQQSRHLFLEEVSDKTAPVRLRVLSCQQLVQAMSEAHRRIIILDKNVRPLRADKQKWMRLNDLLKKGEIPLEPDTRIALKAIDDEIANITPTLTKLSQDAATPTEVKDCAKSALKTLVDLPSAFDQ